MALEFLAVCKTLFLTKMSFFKCSLFCFFVCVSVGGAAPQRWGASAGCQLHGAGGALRAAPRGAPAAAAAGRQGDHNKTLRYQRLTLILFILTFIKTFTLTFVLKIR